MIAGGKHSEMENGMHKILLLTGLILAAPIALASDNHSHGKKKDDHGHTMNHGKEGDHAEMPGVHAEAKINAIDGNTVNLSHGPIKDIGWPAMTMDLQLLDGAEVGEVKAGDTVMMMLEKGDDGMYGIRALMPK